MNFVGKAVIFHINFESGIIPHRGSGGFKVELYPMKSTIHGGRIQYPGSLHVQ